MTQKSNQKKDIVIALGMCVTGAVTALSLAACGKAPAAAAGNVTLQQNPLAGPSAAWLPLELFNKLLGINNVFAGVSTFTSFKLCNDTLVITDINGNTVPVNGAPNGAGLGVITVNGSATTPTALGTLNLPANTQIKEIDVTSAVNTAICPSFPDAVQFDPGSGVIHISQNTAFKFKYSTPITISGSAQSLTLLFGGIVNSMVSYGAGLNGSNIQNAAVLGQAQ